MSLPREILDQLLSGYLDDALSADERNRVETLLRSDPKVARELEQLRQIRASLREVYRAGAKPLGDKFAERVIESAVTQAHAEGLRDDHPVVRLAEQPSTSTVSPRWRFQPRVAIAIAALAASILLAIALALPLRHGGEAERVAENDPAAAAEEETSDQEASTPRGGGADAPQQPALAAGAPDEEDAAAGDRFAGNESLDHLEQTLERVADATVDGEAMPEEPESPRAEPESPSERVAASEPSGLDDAEAAAEQRAAPESGPGLQGAMLVFDVRQTEQGRATRAVQAAMRAASLDSASQKKVSEAIVRAVTETVEPVDESGASILYLQAPAKRLDQFFLTLVNDRDGIESVAMSLVTDAPVLEMVQSLQEVEPTEVRHEAAWQLDADKEGTIGALSRRLADRSFLPLDAATASMGVSASAAPPSQGADVMSQVLVLVR